MQLFKVTGFMACGCVFSGVQGLIRCREDWEVGNSLSMPPPHTSHNRNSLNGVLKGIT